MMPWYTYLFFILAAVAFFLGAGTQAQRRNTPGLVFALCVSGVWLLLALWTGGFLGG